jgi:glucokinase
MGHVLADINGPDCYCGHKGCFESLWSGSALNRRAKENGYQDFDDLYSAGLEKEDRACSLMEKITLQYKNGMWNLMIIFKPQIVVLGGGLMKKYFSFAEGLLRDDLDRVEDFVEPFGVYPAGEFGDPALVGASRLIL